ncbi:SNF2 family N-terminal domain-containing protein [Lophiotrema nucula]|uniref:SNF2 family N-terminal domain-containing protein n=1 Tax=Lophiotrema nucula TaxID=690887 RepID=A0A6A5ZCT7_9PLEO|nr:SNF2 family N-terminal domain-containing protein [Lophiotrema nucula]
MEKARSAWRTSGSTATLRFDMNVYGHGHASQAVARMLSSVRVFLQSPDVDPRSALYENPQYLKLPDLPSTVIKSPTEFTGRGALAALSTETTRSEVEALFDQLQQSSFLRQISADKRVTTPLKEYQKEAVDFMTRRETGDLPPSLSLWQVHTTHGGLSCYQHVITGAKSSRVEDVLGGVLADDMGLGKTLSTLAVIVGSLDRALQFAVSGTDKPTTQWQSMVPSKATLVVVPSALLLDIWTEEIVRHIMPGTLRFYRYHGSRRHISLQDLLQYDVLLTTYATVAAEFCRGQSMLNHIEWFRVVLDEAHVIRNPSTKQFRAISSLAAHLRWCLTGTPIQNGVEDLGAIVKFLRVPLLLETPTFRKQITAAIQSNSPGRFAKLRRLLEALCLRRSKLLLNLPDPITVTHKIHFSGPERQMYNDYGDSCKRATNEAITDHSLRKANQIIIETILRMRLFCNQGSAALAGNWNSFGLPSDPQEALSYLQTSGKDAACAQCDSEIISMYQTGDRSSGVLTSCQHLLCGECRPNYEADLEDSVEDERAQCPICGQRGEKSTFILEPAKTSESPVPAAPTCSTKLLALLHHVQKQGAADKCVIFSFWKKTLDAIADIFTASGIPFHRIHGSLSARRRADVLADFEINPYIKVLLITFGTGAVGINKLVVANHIHIVEPQWNPSVESQAIGRILRLGQEKSVTIVRYIMKGTVEETVQSSQLRKLQLARGGFIGKDDEHTSQRIQEIMVSHIRPL